MNDGSPLFRARFQWQPTLTAHDPDNVLTLEDGVAAQTYTFTGDIAITFAVTADVDFGDVQPTDVALTFGVASPLAATYAEPVAVALALTVASDVDFGDTQPADVAMTFGVASPLAVTYAEPVAVALAFGVDSAQTATYGAPVDVALSFAVDSPFEHIPAIVEAESSGGSTRGIITVASRPSLPRVYSIQGKALFPIWKAESQWSASVVPAAGITIRSFQPSARLAVGKTYSKPSAMPRFHPSSRRVFVEVIAAPPFNDIEELVLVGVL